MADLTFSSDPHEPPFHDVKLRPGQDGWDHPFQTGPAPWPLPPDAVGETAPVSPGLWPAIVYKPHDGFLVREDSVEAARAGIRVMKGIHHVPGLVDRGALAIVQGAREALAARRVARRAPLSALAEQ